MSTSVPIAPDALNEHESHEDAAAQEPAPTVPRFGTAAPSKGWEIGA
jgi:hypothetical protein